MADIIQVIAGFDGSSSAGLCVKSTPATDDEKIALQASATNTYTLGILVNNPADDAVAHVCVAGYCLAVAGEAIRPYEMVRPGTGGKLFKADASTDLVIGRYTPAVQGTSQGPDAAADELIRVKIFDNKQFVVA